MRKLANNVHIARNTSLTREEKARQESENVLNHAERVATLPVVWWMGPAIACAGLTGAAIGVVCLPFGLVKKKIAAIGLGMVVGGSVVTALGVYTTVAMTVTAPFDAVQAVRHRKRHHEKNDISSEIPLASPSTHAKLMAEIGGSSQSDNLSVVMIPDASLPIIDLEKVLGQIPPVTNTFDVPPVDTAFQAETSSSLGSSCRM